MMRKRMLILLCVVMLLLTGCGENTVTILTEKEDDIVAVPILFRLDPETGEERYKSLIDGFNKEYAGKYKLDVQWINDTEQGYRDRLKILNAFEQLPLIITDAAFSADFRDLMIYNERFLNLYPYLEDREEWQEFLKDSSNEVYLVPLNMGLYSSAGLYYNNELFQKAGVEEFPQTWDEFFECLDKLKEAGITPLALHGSGEYWAYMLISTAYMCYTDTGKNFLEEYFPDSYDNQSTREMLSCMYTIYGYTFDDALEINFNQAQDRFLRGEAAILANGYWMLQDIEESKQEDFGFAQFPGGAMMVDEQMSSQALISGYSDEEIEGAVEFLTYRQKISRVDEEIASVLEKEYISVFKDTENIFVNYQFRWNEQLLNEFFNSAFPEFLQGDGDITLFIEQMNEELKGK